MRVSKPTIQKVNGLSCGIRGDGANTLDDDAATAADEATRLIFYGYGQAPAATVNADGTMTLPAGVKDRVGTIDAKGAVWSLAGKGQSGRTGAGEEGSCN